MCLKNGAQYNWFGSVCPMEEGNRPGWKHPSVGFRNAPFEIDSIRIVFSHHSFIDDYLQT